MTAETSSPVCGDVMRGQLLGAAGEDVEEEFITIDNRDFTVREFVRMALTFDGWGIRLVFVLDVSVQRIILDDEVHEQPEILVQDREPRRGLIDTDRARVRGVTCSPHT